MFRFISFDTSHHASNTFKIIIYLPNYKYPKTEHIKQCKLKFSAGSSYGNESVEMSPSLKNNVSVNSKTLALNSIETSISKIVTSEGNWLNLQKCGVSLFVPEGTIDKGEELFSIEVADEEWNRPILQEGKNNQQSILCLED